MPVSREEQDLAAAALVEGLQSDAPIGFAVHDEELRFVLVSRSLAAMNGLPVQHHVGRRVTDILPPELGEPVERLLAGVRDSGTAQTGVEIDGTTDAFPGEVRTWVSAFFPIRLGERRLVGVVVVDVTERRRAQAELEESERVLSGAQQMAGLGWWTWTAEPETVTYAPELLELMGRDPALGGSPQARDQLIMADPGELDAVREDALASLASGRPFARRVRARDAGGQPRLLEARADVLYDGDGRAVGLQGFVQDITDLERAVARQRIVAELGQAALAGAELDELMRRAVEAVASEVGVDGAAVLELLPEGDEMAVRASMAPPGYAGPSTVPVTPGTAAERALATRQPVVIGDRDAADFARTPADLAAGSRSSAAVVIGGRDRPWGLIGAMSREPDHFTADDATFLQSLANVLSDAVERRLAEAEIAELSAARGRLVAQALDAEERARRRISEALHDGPLQELVAARHDLYALAGRGGDDAALQAAQDELGTVIRRLREVMSALHPTVLQYGGLEAALHAVTEQHAGAGGFETELHVDDEAVGIHDGLVLSVAREALANAARHAGATRVEVEVRREAGDVVVAVADDGAGLAEERTASGGIGLATCRERVEAVGGHLSVEGADGGGTRVVATLPPPDRSVGISGLGSRADGE